MKFGLSRRRLMVVQVLVLVLSVIITDDVTFSHPIPLPLLPPSPAPAHPPHGHGHGHGHHHGPAHPPLVKPPAHPPVKPPAAHPPLPVVKPPAHPPVVKPPSSSAHPPLPVVKPPSSSAHPPLPVVKPPAHPPVVKPPSSSAHPPLPVVKPPAHPPVVKPPSSSAHPPIPSPIIKRSFIAVQGVVYCESCNYTGKDSLLAAKPISGAVVKLACNNTKYGVVEKAKTDKNGYFFMSAPKTITNYAFHKCKVFLLYSPLPNCSKPANLNAALTGAPLKPYKPLTINNLPFTLYSVGPFAFEPKCIPSLIN